MPNTEELLNADLTRSSLLVYTRSWVSSFGIAAEYVLDSQGSISGRGKRFTSSP
jgi:hypothetical protein